MKIHLHNLLLTAALLLFTIIAFAQPTATYTSPGTYTVGTAITTLSPTATGVATFNYGTGTALAGTSNGPRNIVFDASGNLYVANYTANTVRKYDATGTFVSNYGTGAPALNRPSALVFDSFGNGYVVNSTGGTVYKYNSAGVYQSTLISGLSSPGGITIDASNNLYIANSGDNSIKKYSSVDGTLLLTITSNVSNPTGVTVDAAGNIYSLNKTPETITKYNSSGAYQPPSLITGLNAPWAMSSDYADNFYIGNSGANRINIYNKTGTSLKNLTGVTDAEGVATDSKGNLYVSSYSANAVYKFVPTGGYFINAKLPAGLSFSSTNGRITGTPTVTAPTTTYTITAWGATSNTTATVNIGVGPAVTAPAICFAGALTMTASGGGPAGGAYNWYTAATGGTPVYTGATYAPVLATSGTFYVDYTTAGGVSSPRTAVTATINPTLSSPVSNAALSYSFSGNTKDVSGNENDGILQNAPTPTTDRYGATASAYNFNGTSQWIATTKPVTDAQTFSISLWFNTTTTTGGRLAGYSGAQDGTGLLDRHIYMTNTGTLYFGVYVSGYNTVNTTTAYNDGKWHHVIATLSPTNGINLYVDNVLKGSNAAYKSASPHNGYWNIGGGNINGWPFAPTSVYFTGAIDDVAIYNTELSAANVLALNNINQIGAYAPVCSGNPITIHAPTITGATYTWTAPNGVVVTGQDATFPAAVAGSYSLTITGGPGGCSPIVSYTPTIYAVPTATFTAPSSVDINKDATFTFTGSGATSYLWDFNGGTPTPTALTGSGPYTVKWSTPGLKTVTLTVTNANGCSVTFTKKVAVSALTFSSYAFRKQLTLKSSTLGITEDQTNFPALVYIQDNSLIISNTCSNKVQYPNGNYNGSIGTNYDFAFLDPNSATELNYQVESYNQTTGTLLIWVKIPTLYAATDNTLSFYFGSLTPAHSAAFYSSTWSSDYLAVYHFNEDPSTTVLDATNNHVDGTAYNITAVDDKIHTAAGFTGGGYNFSGASKIISTKTADIIGSFTLSAWVNVTNPAADNKVVSNELDYGPGYKLGVKSNVVETETRSTNLITKVGNLGDGGTVTSGWHYIQGTFNGTTFKNYVDSIAATTVLTKTAPSIVPLAGGVVAMGIDHRSVTDENFYTGLMDEVRISNVVKSANWIKAEYTNQTAPITFTDYSAFVTTNHATAAAIPGALTYTWAGVTSTDPANAANWTNTTEAIIGDIPSNANASIIIPSSLAKYPVFTADAAFYGVTIAPGANIDLNGKKLTVGCNVYNNGRINAAGVTNASTIEWNGIFTPQLYKGNTTTLNTAQFGNFTVNNTAASGQVKISGGPVDLYNTLTLTSGSLVVDNAANGALTLKSSGTVTARVAAIPPALSVTGNVTVERWFTGGPNKRGWRLMSSPVNNSATLPLTAAAVHNFSSLQTNLPVTGPIGTADGFDRPAPYVINGATVLFYDSPTFLFYSPAKVTSTAKVGSGFYFFFRGNRNNMVTKLVRVTPTTPYPDPEPDVVGLQTGTLNQQGFTYPLSNLGRRYNQVGNPYPSSISIGSSDLTGTTGFIYTYSTGNSMLTQAGPATIASGQGFFVRANATGPSSVTFSEALKVATQPTGPDLLLGMPKGSQAPIISLKMMQDSANYDVTHLRFLDTYKKGYDEMEDADDLNGPSQTVLFGAITGDDHLVAIASQPLEKQNTSVFLSVNASASGLYSLQKIDLSSIPAAYDVWLMDHFKNDSLDIRANDTYRFNLDKADPQTFGNTRFEVLIRKKILPPYQLLSFKGTRAGADVMLNWNTLNEYDYTSFELQKSTDGVNFDAVKNMQSSSQGAYAFKDIYNSSSADVWYRLKQTDINGQVSYSQVIIISVTGSGSFSIFPNPASNIIQFKLDIPVKSQVQLRIFNATGILMKNTTFTTATGQQDISSLTPGNYTIELTDLSSKKIIITAKFIKI